MLCIAPGLVKQYSLARARHAAIMPAFLPPYNSFPIRRLWGLVARRSAQAAPCRSGPETMHSDSKLPGNGDPVVQVRGLSKEFGRFVAVDDLSFESRRGEIFGLLGPNGAGKTTTLRMLGTTLTPTRGTAVVAGHDVAAAPAQVRRSIGVLTAAIGLYGRLTARENVAYFGRLHGLGDAEIHRRVEGIFERLEMQAYADRPAEAFSTGMKQKVAIARAIIHEPPVVILDEPTSGLDVLACQLVREFMREMRGQGRCVILSTHLMWDAELLCDRVAIVHGGRLIALDTVAGLKERTGTQNLEDAFMRLVREDGAPK